MFGFFGIDLLNPVKEKCINLVDKDDGFMLKKVSCGGDIYPEKINGKIVFVCGKCRRVYTEEEIKNIPSG